MSHDALIDAYLDGPRLLREAVAGMTDAQLDARPIPGKWSTRQVVCHVADFEPIYADRMKRVIAQPSSLFFGGGSDLFAAKLAYDRRDVAEELELIDVVRRQMARILRTVSEADFQNVGTHSEDGPLTLETLLKRIAGHIPHHLPFIAEKRKALA